jgi:hypothetical protein
MLIKESMLMKIRCVFAHIRNKNKSISKFQLCLLSILFITQFLFASAAQAIVESQALSFRGNIIYPNNLSENLVVIPDSFMSDINYYGYVSIDYTTTHNGNPSIKVEPDYERGTREVNCIWPEVNPGDHIVWKVWCKTSDDVKDTVYTGGRIGIDLIGAYGGIINTVDALPRDFTTSIDGQWRSGNWDSYHYNTSYPESGVYPNLGTPLLAQFKVPFSATDWTLIYWEFTVPDTTYYWRNGYPATQITHVGPWIDVRGLTDGIVWFADSEFYINP